MPENIGKKTGNIMRFGLQKLTLLDFPGLVACTVFTCGCNFRCPFCHNASLVTGNEEEMALDESELLDFLASRTGRLDGVCITGGEPLLHAGTIPLIGKIRELGFQVKLDTNGSFPERLAEVLDPGLVNRVAVDIKNSPEKYALTSGNPAILDKVRESVRLLMGQTKIPYEFRTTVVDGFHETADFTAIGQWIQGAPEYYLQPFTDSGDILHMEPGKGALPDEKLREFLAAVLPFVPAAKIRGR